MSTESPSAVIAESFQLGGIVQGVGMRPHVYRLAQELGIRGCVFNHNTGIRINAWAAAEILEEFATKLITNSPPLAKNISLQRHELNGSRPASFKITASTTDRASAELPPDSATCPECLQEILDPQ
ncbi:MAG: acylphosphatase, partial [Gammaproteobacteria bacterium]|nr:acylphosphatase [Gammaproteobacteria bacterium]